MKESTIAISVELQNIAKTLEKVINTVAGEPIAFTLIVYTEERASYVSNAAREDAVREIKKLLECWENGLPDIPAHRIT